jgi:FAD/FMN-containing dehydrogenase
MNDALQAPDVLQPLPDGGWRMTPRDVGQVCDILKLAHEAEQPLSLTRRGAMALGQPVWLDLHRLNRVRDYRPKDLTVTVETGITMGALGRSLNGGQRFPLSYPDDMPLLTVLAEDRPALESGCYGYPRDWVLGVELVTPQGEVTHAGGQVVKNVTGYDLAKLYVGSHHAFGALTAVTLKLVANPQATRTLMMSEADLPQALEHAQVLLNSDYPVVRCEVFQDAVGSWQVYAQLAGPEALIAHCPHPEAAYADVQRLMSWPERMPVAELAVPVHRVADIPAPGKGVRAQIRPAAGLFYLLGQEEAAWAEALPEFAELARTLGGHLQVLQAPEDRFFTQYNAAPDPMACRWSQQLKQHLDPKGILVDPRWVARTPAG